MTPRLPDYLSPRPESWKPEEPHETTVYRRPELFDAFLVRCSCGEEAKVEASTYYRGVPGVVIFEWQVAHLEQLYAQWRRAAVWGGVPSALRPHRAVSFYDTPCSEAVCG